MTTQNRTHEGPHCPGCGTPIQPVLYGYPSSEAIDSAMKGEIRLGGCIPPMSRSEHIRDRYCRRCGSTPVRNAELVENLIAAQCDEWLPHGPAGFRGSPYRVAREELLAGRKTTHWMWYVFPQISLGKSPNSVLFAVNDTSAVIEILDDDFLGASYRDAVDIVASHVLDNRGDRTPWEALVDLFGSRVDAKKFVSSITLFGDVARESPEHDDVSRRAERFFDAGVRPCATTRKRLAAGEVRYTPSLFW